MAVVVGMRRDGSGLEPLTDGTEHSGFPSYSADGKQIVFRVWGEKDAGLHVIDLDTRQVRTLTTEYDNLPQWSPDGSKIFFTRKVDEVNFDIFTIRPGGSDLTRLTTNRANDGHAYWVDGKSGSPGTAVSMVFVTRRRSTTIPSSLTARSGS